MKGIEGRKITRISNICGVGKDIRLCVRSWFGGKGSGYFVKAFILRGWYKCLLLGF